MCQFFDISGKELRSIYFNIPNESIEVDCTSFGPGSYYIHILDAEGNIAVAKFIKIWENKLLFYYFLWVV